MTDQQIEIGIFGGTGIYDSGLLEDSKEITIETPYGKTSDTITVGQYNSRNIAFLPRHGKKHTIPPHLINYRANIWAFKELGIKRIIAPSAVGSLKEEIKPEHFVIPAQFLDFTKSRKTSFSEEGKVIHIQDSALLEEGKGYNKKHTFIFNFQNIFSFCFLIILIIILKTKNSTNVGLLLNSYPFWHELFFSTDPTRVYRSRCPYS